MATVPHTARRVDLFDSTYRHFSERVLKSIREETFGEDIGQNSWLTREEYERFTAWLEIEPGHHVLEVASGAGGPAAWLVRQTGCRVTGIDVNDHGVAAATLNAAVSDLADRLDFRVADADAPLPFADETFDALTCIDSMNHFPERARVLREWHRVLRPGGRALFTDPVVITGPVTNDELALRSAVGLFLFVSPRLNRSLIESAGFNLIREEDVSGNAALVSGRWRQARQRHRRALLEIEGEDRYEGLQRFFDTVHRLTSERRLSRVAYLAEKS